MAESIANVNILADTFEGWLLRHNQMAHLMSTAVMTANTTGANTGNSSVSRIAQLWGTLGANTIVVSTGIRGGNATNSSSISGVPFIANAELYVASAAGANVPLLKVGNSTVITQVDLYGLRAGNGASNTVISNSSIISQSNSTVKTTILPTSITVANDTVNVSITAYGLLSGIVGANQSHLFAGANVIIGATSVAVGNATHNAVMTSQELLISNSTSSSSVREDGITTTGTLDVTGVTTLLGNVNANAAVTLANTLSVAGPASVSNTLTVKTDYVVDVGANSDIGSNTTAEQLIYRFPKTTYSSGKLIVQVKNGTNTQISEIVLAHNTSNAYLTVYGTVSSPPSGNSSPLLATFSANINNANVELLVIQTQANSSVKIVGHLIK